jgi:hypothetical protein
MQIYKKGERKMTQPIYTGVFFTASNIYAKITPALSKKIDNPHVTVRFRPESVDKRLFGAEVAASVVGYACDGRNEGWRVELHSDNVALQDMLDRIAVPHITLSVSEDGQPVDTAKLHFHAIKPFAIAGGKFGGFYPNSGVVVKPSQKKPKKRRP